jgi:hypothetical protein
MLLHTLRTQLDYFQRLLRNSIQKTPVESMIAVSSIRVRGAHGNSLVYYFFLLGFILAFRLWKAAASAASSA